jgi:hypothetical protein
LGDYLKGFRQDATQPGYNQSGIVGDQETAAMQAQTRNAALDAIMKDPALLQQATGKSMQDWLATTGGAEAAAQEARSGVQRGHAMSAEQEATLGALANIMGYAADQTEALDYGGVNAQGLGGAGMQKLYEQMSPALEKYLSESAGKIAYGGALDKPIQQIQPTNVGYGGVALG